MRVHSKSLLFPFLLFAFELSAAEPTPFQPDEHTALLAHFDGSANANHATGSGLANGVASLAEDGRFGGGLRLGQGQYLSFPGGKNFPREQGTLEFWIHPDWPGNDPQVRSVFGAAFGEHNYLNINKLPDGRFGAGISGQRGDEPFVYRRADKRIHDWRTGEWHHVAVCWGEGELSLWLDGELANRKTETLAPIGTARELSFTGSDHILDEVCLSAIIRYRGEGRITGRPIEPQPRLREAWKFNEPDEVYRLPKNQSAFAEAGISITPVDYLDEVDPASLPAPVKEPVIRLFASPGEREPAAFVLSAAKPLKQVTISLSDLTSVGAKISADSVAIRRVVRTPMRWLYTSAADQTGIVNRFLPRWRNTDIPDGEFREIWLGFDIPDNQAPRLYRGKVTIRHREGQREVPVELEVLPVRLVEHPKKALASYYRMARKLLDPDRALRELRDLYDHGVRHLITDLSIRYIRGEDGVEPDLSDLQRGLELIRRAGFSESAIVAGTGLSTLAIMQGHKDARPPGTGASLAKDADFQRVAKQAMTAFVGLENRFPGLRLIATHMDEVFNSDRLPLYLKLSRAVRQVPEARLYITFHTAREDDDAKRREIDPFADIRGHHGYTFEWWLSRGHTIDEYERELRQSGDEAWFYHNARGVHFTAEWSRIINGLYLWASPFSAHAPWTYQAYQQNPFDDTDGPFKRGHDFGMSFPGAEDPADLVPTRLWEAMREGGDDLRYLATLEAAIRDARGKPAEVRDAREFLARLRSLVRGARIAEQPDLPDDSPAGGEIDLDTGIAMGTATVGSSAEAPLIDALARRFTGAQWREIRREIADRIVRLQ